MSAPDDGGPMFPRPDLGKAHFDSIESYPGLSIRDYFAAHALAGISGPHCGYSVTEAGKRAYDLADAALAARPAPSPLPPPKKETP